MRLVRLASSDPRHGDVYGFGGGIFAAKKKIMTRMKQISKGTMTIKRMGTSLRDFFFVVKFLEPNPTGVIVTAEPLLCL